MPIDMDQSFFSVEKAPVIDLLPVLLFSPVCMLNGHLCNALLEMRIPFYTTGKSDAFVIYRASDLHSIIDGTTSEKEPMFLRMIRSISAEI